MPRNLDKDTEPVAAVLRKYFPSAPWVPSTARLFAIGISLSNANGQFEPLFGQPRFEISPEFDQMATAVAKIIETVPAILEQAALALKVDPFSACDTGFHQRMESLLQAAYAVLPDCKPAFLRPPNKNSYWHGTARFFAEQIEINIKKFGNTLPSRKSVKSRLVLSVHDLLSLAGCEQTLDAIRDALKKTEDEIRATTFGMTAAGRKLFTLPPVEKSTAT